MTCGATSLADATREGGIVEGLRVNGTNQLQIVQPIQAAAIVIFDRGNKRNSVEFTISIEHPTAAAAILFAFTQADLMPGKADMGLIFNDGTNVVTIGLPGAGWSSTTPEPNGRTTKTQYQIVGGKFTHSAVFGDATGHDHAPTETDILNQAGQEILNETGDAITQ